MWQLLQRLFRRPRLEPCFPRMWFGGTEWNYRGPGVWQHVRDEELSKRPKLVVDNTTPKARLERILATPVEAPLTSWYLTSGDLERERREMAHIKF